MKVLFLCVFLINIIFFVWEYRKGAPEIYLPPNYEKSLGSAKYVQQIKLLTEISEIKELADQGSAIPIQQSARKSNIDTDNEIFAIETQQLGLVNNTGLQMIFSEIVAENIFIGPNDIVTAFKGEENFQNSIQQPSARYLVINYPLFACYQLKKGKYTKKTLTQKMQDYAYKLDLVKQQQGAANSYLLLTLAADSLEQAISLKQEMKQQGVDDLWLFRKGVYKWRISLGIFFGKNKVKKAKEQLSSQINQALEVVPGSPSPMLTRIKISARDKQGLFAFEQKYADIIEKKNDCKQGKP